MYCSVVLRFPDFSFERKGNQCNRRAFIPPIMLYSIGSVHVMRECMQSRLTAIFFMSFSCKHYGKFLANIASKKITQVRIEECNTSSFICRVYLNSFCSSRYLNCDTVFNMIVSLLNECVRYFNNFRNGRVKGSR